MLSIVGIRRSCITSDLHLQTASRGLLKPVKIVHPPRNWRRNTAAFFVPNSLNYLCGRLTIVEGVAFSMYTTYDNIGFPVRFKDPLSNKSGDSIASPFSILAIPFESSVHSHRFPDTISVKCEGNIAEMWMSPDIAFESIPGTSADVLVSLAFRHQVSRLTNDMNQIREGMSVCMTDYDSGCVGDVKSRRASLAFETEQLQHFVAYGAIGRILIWKFFPVTDRQCKGWLFVFSDSVDGNASNGDSPT